MRFLQLSIILAGLCLQAGAQSATDEALLAQTRALYDAPFTRGLVSFDCAVQFDWKRHFADTLGSMPPAALNTAERLQSIQHRVFVDRSGAVVSTTPKQPDLSGIPHGADLEQGLDIVIAGGLNAWIPFSTNVILPVAPTRSNFQEIDGGYKLAMDGPGIAATLLLTADLRLTSGVSQRPQPMRFSTEFTDGPDGLLLNSIKTGDPTGASKDATFAYTYQTVQGFQIPFELTATPAIPETWHYVLTDCKATKGVVINVAPPPKS
jgi:hypothetical protein